MSIKTAAAKAATSSLDVNVSGKHMAVGDALRDRIVEELSGAVGKYFDRASGEADVVVHKEGHQVCVDLVIRLPSGQRMVSKGLGGDAHAAFDAALAKIETRIRRYKRKLVSHKPHNGGVGERAELAAYTVLRSPDDEDDAAADEWGRDGSAGSGAPAGAVIAESQAEVKAMTVSMAVMELDLTEAPVVMFRNLAHDGLSVVYRRPDGNIGWIDPQRTAGGAAGASLKA